MVYVILLIVVVLVLVLLLSRRQKHANGHPRQEPNSWSYYDTVFFATTSLRSDVDRSIIFSRVLIDSDQAPMISFSFGKPVASLKEGSYRVVQLAQSESEVHILAGVGSDFFYSADDSGILEVRNVGGRLSLQGHRVKMGLGGYPGKSYSTPVSFNLTEF